MALAALLLPSTRYCHQLVNLCGKIMDLPRMSDVISILSSWGTTSKCPVLVQVIGACEKPHSPAPGRSQNQSHLYLPWWEIAGRRKLMRINFSNTRITYAVSIRYPSIPSNQCTWNIKDLCLCSRNMTYGLLSPRAVKLSWGRTWSKSSNKSKSCASGQPKYIAGSYPISSIVKKCSQNWSANMVIAVPCTTSVSCESTAVCRTQSLSNALGRFNSGICSNSHHRQDEERLCSNI